MSGIVFYRAKSTSLKFSRFDGWHIPHKSQRRKKKVENSVPQPRRANSEPMYDVKMRSDEHDQYFNVLNGYTEADVIKEYESLYLQFRGNVVTNLRDPYEPNHQPSILDSVQRLHVITALIQNYVRNFKNEMTLPSIRIETHESILSRISELVERTLLAESSEEYFEDAFEKCFVSFWKAHETDKVLFSFPKDFIKELLRVLWKCEWCSCGNHRFEIIDSQDVQKLFNGLSVAKKFFERMDNVGQSLIPLDQVQADSQNFIVVWPCLVKISKRGGPVPIFVKMIHLW
jgi:hypothetical protein